MKKTLFFVLFAVIAIVFTSCSKDDDDNFNYPMESVYGTWKGTAINTDGNWVDITKYPYTIFAFSIKLNSDGTYHGTGYFGNGDGTYKAKGNTIYTYVDGEEYLKYDIISFSGNKAELAMGKTSSDQTIKIKVEKQ